MANLSRFKVFIKNNSLRFTDATSHYIHIVWAAIDKVGCGLNQCNNTLNLVCNYGSSYDMNPTIMYKPGPPCSKCPSGTACKNSLCSNIAPGMRQWTNEETTTEGPVAPGKLATVLEQLYSIKESLKSLTDRLNKIIKNLLF